ncbi:hypothetical protein [Enterobacter hormaechei]|uniref:hypothetical protein n=1 Tax=Enterobacter hormaechei TaxID=158836 RepID=UPI002FFA44B0
MKLIDILVQELPKRGGWPHGSERCMQTDGLYVTFPDIGDHCDFVAKCMAEGIRIATREQYEAAIAASKPEWDGEGIPPVGTVCEYTKQSLTVKEWTECTVDYVGSSFIVYRDCYGVELTGIKGDIKFRPVRSEADKKKEEVVFAIAELCRQSASNGHSAELIYDAIKSGKIVID